MEKTTVNSADVPTALPGFEEDDAREKLLLESSSGELDDTAEEVADEAEELAAKPNKRRWRVLKTFAGFALFLCVLIVGVAWFFGMGWFAKPQLQAVNRSGQKDTTAAPITGDEKLKMAVNMVAPQPSASVTGSQHTDSSVPADISQTGIPVGKSDVDLVPPKNTTGQDPKPSAEGKESYSLVATENRSPSEPIPSNYSEVIGGGDGNESRLGTKATDSEDARGRSLFFGVTPKDAPVREENRSDPQPASPKAPGPTATSTAEIPFGTMLPVRLLGSIYTLQKSGGFVRMELTRPLEGKGYSYPAGTMVVGEVRGGESVRAFVNVMGLIDPVSGELHRFSGELLGTDGASGIEGKRRNLTSQWSRFFSGMKETAASVLGSVGALRSGGTVILSEPMRRGSESMTEDLSGALLKNGREDTFLEVAAGSTGYVLVTDLPEKAPSLASRATLERAKE